MHAFLAFTRAARRFDRGLEPPADATTGGVKLLTAHKAKGLEFAHKRGVTHRDIKPANIVTQLNLLRPIYSKTTNYGHFGKNDKDISWEKTDKAVALKKAAGL